MTDFASDFAREDYCSECLAEWYFGEDGKRACDCCPVCGNPPPFVGCTCCMRCGVHNGCDCNQTEAERLGGMY